MPPTTREGLDKGEIASAAVQLAAQLREAEKHERHRNLQETMYWFNQYKRIAREAVQVLLERQK